MVCISGEFGHKKCHSYFSRLKLVLIRQSNMFAWGVQDWRTSEHNLSLYLAELPFVFVTSINWIAVLEYLPFVQLARSDPNAMHNLWFKNQWKLFSFRRISGEFSHKNVSAFSSPIKLVSNENSQICSLAAIATDHEFDGALNAKIHHFRCRIRCWLSQRQSLAFRKIVWLQMRAPIHRFWAANAEAKSKLFVITLATIAPHKIQERWVPAQIFPTSIIIRWFLSIAGSLFSDQCISGEFSCQNTSMFRSIKLVSRSAINKWL